MHQCLFWGVILSFAITFPLTFGWVHFEAVAAHALPGLSSSASPSREFDALGPIGFNTLPCPRLHRRAGDHRREHRLLAPLERPRASSRQQRVLFDLLPLHLLMAISITGLMLTVVDFFFEGWAHWPITLTHQFLVIMLILYLPFGKLFHIIERPASLGVEAVLRGRAPSRA